MTVTSEQDERDDRAAVDGAGRGPHAGAVVGTEEGHGPLVEQGGEPVDGVARVVRAGAFAARGAPHW